MFSIESASRLLTLPKTSPIRTGHVHHALEKSNNLVLTQLTDSFLLSFLSFFHTTLVSLLPK
jgi:hypothetical protein